jgi:hypothetical protein
LIIATLHYVSDFLPIVAWCDADHISFLLAEDSEKAQMQNFVGSSAPP